MAFYPFVWLRGRNYHLPRRVPFGSSAKNPISISLKTRDPDRARILARRLAARWDSEATHMSSINHLTLDQHSTIYRDTSERLAPNGAKDRSEQLADLTPAEIELTRFLAHLCRRPESQRRCPLEIISLAQSNRGKANTTGALSRNL